MSDTRKTKTCRACHQVKSWLEFPNGFLCQDCTIRRVCNECNEEKDADKFNNRDGKCKRCQSDAKLIKKYGINNDEKDEMNKEQNNRCAICKQLFKKTPCIDHKDKPLRVRGLLCGKCNIGIGQFDDDTVFMVSAVHYLITRDVVVAKKVDVDKLIEGLEELTLAANDLRKEREKKHEEEE